MTTNNASFTRIQTEDYANNITWVPGVGEVHIQTGARSPLYGEPVLILSSTTNREPHYDDDDEWRTILTITYRAATAAEIETLGVCGGGGHPVHVVPLYVEQGGHNAANDQGDF